MKYIKSLLIIVLIILVVSLVVSWFNRTFQPLDKEQPQQINLELIDSKGTIVDSVSIDKDFQVK